MPYKKPEIKKLYYTIGEVAEMFEVNTSLIRFWENEFEIIKPRKNAKGNRLFTEQDIENLHKIYALVKEKGFTLQGAKDHLKSKEQVPASNFELVQNLKKIRQRLIEIKDNL